MGPRNIGIKSIQRVDFDQPMPDTSAQRDLQFSKTLIHTKKIKQIWTKPARAVLEPTDTGKRYQAILGCWVCWVDDVGLKKGWKL